MANLYDITRRLPSPRKKLGADRIRALFHAGFIVLMLGLIGFAVYQGARHVTVGLNTLRTQEILDESYVRLELFLFRDERILEAPGSDTYLYTAGDGERVGVGQSLCTPYAVGDPETARELQKRLNAYGTRIALLEELGGSGNPSDVRAAAEAADKAYMELLRAAGRGDLASADGYAGGMLDSLDRYAVLTGTVSGHSPASLRAERSALMANYLPMTAVRAARSGYFYYDCDGYEAVFDYASAMTVTPEEFRAMTERTAEEVPAGAVGKMVFDSTWYAAAYIPLSDGSVEVFQQGMNGGASYTMLCGDGADTELTMTLVRMVPDAGGALVVFSCRDMPAGFDFPRSFMAETVSLRTKGYRIPTEAVVTLRSDETGEDMTGVYILAGNVVEFRKISIRVRRDGYVIAETWEDVRAYLDTLAVEDPAEYERRTADGKSYLGLNDNIITRGNELYEGKVIG